MTTLYGIKNCDTVKKSRTWLDDHGVAYQFHDFKIMGVPDGLIEKALKTHPWDVVLNKRGTTWRTLPDDVKNAASAATAIKIAHDFPSAIKRPILVIGDDIYIGFDPNTYAKATA